MKRAKLEHVTTVDALPFDVLICVMSLVDVRKLSMCARCCKRWNEAVKRMLRDEYENVAVIYRFELGELDLYGLRMMRRANVDRAVRLCKTVHHFMCTLFYSEFPSYRERCDEFHDDCQTYYYADNTLALYQTNVSEWLQDMSKMKHSASYRCVTRARADGHTSLAGPFHRVLLFNNE